MSAGHSQGRGSLPAPLACSDCRREPCGVCRQVKRAKQRAGAVGYEGPHFTGAEWLALILECKGRCLRCGSREPLTVDHVIPLARGGSNAIENIQPLCAVCNGIKGCETTDYRASRGLLSGAPGPFRC